MGVFDDGKKPATPAKGSPTKAMADANGRPTRDCLRDFERLAQNPGVIGTQLTKDGRKAFKDGVDVLERDAALAKQGVKGTVSPVDLANLRVVQQVIERATPNLVAGSPTAACFKTVESEVNRLAPKAAAPKAGG